MHIALFFWDRLPVPDYGGTQRVVVYLARGLAAAGHRVTLLAGRGSRVPEASLVPLDLARARRPDFDIRPLLPSGLDLVLACAPLRVPPDVPWIRRLAGNWKPGSQGGPNTIYLSRDHARRYGGRAWVYNGLDPTDYSVARPKQEYDLFLGRLHRVKGYRWAIAGAKRTRRRLVLAGGWRPSLSRYVKYVGKVGGERRAELLASARVLWMPALWEEPFGNTLIEALASGTPVLGTRRGSLPEIVTSDVGYLGDTLDELIERRPTLDAIAPETCRSWVERHFSHHVMAEEYVRVFREYLGTGVLPAGRSVVP